MQIRGVTLAEIRRITEAVSLEKFDGNVVIKSAETLTKNGLSHRVKFGVENSRGKGARKSWTGRRGPWACFDSFYEVLNRLFKEYPDAVVVSAMARFDGQKSFFQQWSDVGGRNVGSMMNPIAYEDLCDCNKQAQNPLRRA